MSESCERCNQRKDDIRKVVVRKGAVDVIRDLCEACRNLVAETYLVLDLAADEGMKGGPAITASPDATPVASDDAAGIATTDDQAASADTAPAPKKKPPARRRRRGRTQSKGGTN